MKFVSKPVFGNVPSVSLEALALVEAAPVGVAYIDCRLRYVYLNDRLAKIFGLSRDTCLRRTAREVVPAFGVSIEPLLRRVLKTGGPVHSEKMSEAMTDMTAGRRDWNLLCYPVRNAASMLLGIGLIVVEITRQKRAEEMGGRSERAVNELIESAPVGFHMLGQDGRIHQANKAELTLLGYASEEYVGRHFSEFHADPAAATEILRRLMRNEPVRNEEARLLAKDGSIKHVTVSYGVQWDGPRFLQARCWTYDLTACQQA
ncbi:MAG: hypothetical protein C4293_16940, partial [Nitrospiraceae bacterium]